MFSLIVFFFYGCIGTAGCSFSSALVHLRLLSKSEPPSLSSVFLGYVFTPCISVHDSWRRTDLVKDESSETQSNVWVPKLTKTSVTWQKLKLQGFQFWHFYQWTETKKSFLLQDNNCSHCRSSLIRHCLPNPNLNRNEVKHLAPCTTSIPCFPSHLLRLSFACFCCSWYQVTNSHKSLSLMKMIQQTSTWQRRQVYYRVPKLD